VSFELFSYTVYTVTKQGLKMNKQAVFMRDVVCEYHPDFKSNSSLKQFALAMPARFNIELLIEETLAHVGGMQFVDESGYDFLPDYSDSKTVTVNRNSRVAEISSVETKIGAIRITAYNPFKGSCDYFFVPRASVALVKEPCYARKSVLKERIKFTYSSRGDHYGKFEQYRVASFPALALAR
jgi:hypothetical protein